MDEISFHQRYPQQLSPLCQIPVSIASLQKLLWYLIYMLKFVGRTVERIIWGMFLLMISLYSESDVFIQILLLCLCACEHMRLWAHVHTCMYVHMCCREQRKNLRCCPSQVQSVHCCFVCLVGWLVFLSLVVVVFFCSFCSVWGRFSHWPGVCRLGWLASEPRGSTVSTSTGWELLHCPQQGTKMNPPSLKLLLVEQVSGHSD